MAWRRNGAYCSLHRSSAILVYGLSQMTGHGLSWIIVDYRRTIMDYRGLWWVDYVSWIIVDYYYCGLSSIRNYPGLLQIIIDITWRLSQMIMDYHGLLWITRYAPPCNRMSYHRGLSWIDVDCYICTPSL